MPIKDAFQQQIKNNSVRIYVVLKCSEKDVQLVVAEAMFKLTHKQDCSQATRETEMLHCDYRRDPKLFQAASESQNSNVPASCSAVRSTCNTPIWSCTVPTCIYPQPCPHVRLGCLRLVLEPHDERQCAQATMRAPPQDAAS
jgi:hypothetical protein